MSTNRQASSSAPHAASRWRFVSSLAALFFLVVVGRMIFVSLYAESVPFWDQWDAEGRFLIKPWLEGKLGIDQLFAAHNEHRILFTRLLSLAQLEANNGQWDNMVSAYANVLLYAAIPVLLYLLLAPGLRSFYGRVLMFLGLLALAWLPYAWENILTGFQSQFYLMSLLAIVAISVASRSQGTVWFPITLLIPLVLGLFTMATGLLGVIAAGAVIFVRILVGQLPVARASWLVGLLVIISLSALISLPHPAGSDILKAQGLTDLFKRLLPILGWPSPYSALLWPLIWLPSLVTIWRLLHDRRISRHQLVALGLSFWALLQIAGIAYSRGSISSRYLDTMAIGLVANLWMALRFLEQPCQYGGKTLPIWLRLAPLSAFLTVTCVGLVRSIPSDIINANQRLQFSTWQTINVRNAVASGNRAYLDNQPSMHIPYPSADVLATLLADDTLRLALPASVRQGLPLAFEQQVGAFQTVSGKQGVMATSCDSSPACLIGTGSWQSQTLATRYPYIQVPLSIKGSSTHGLRLGLTEGEALTSAADISNVSRRLILATPSAGSFHVVSIDSSTQAALNIYSPVEVGRLSWLAMSLQDTVRNWLGYPTSEELQRLTISANSPVSD